MQVARERETERRKEVARLGGWEHGRSGTRGVSRKTDRCQGNEGNLHFVKLSLESWRAAPGKAGRRPTRVKGEDSRGERGVWGMSERARSRRESEGSRRRRRVGEGHRVEMRTGKEKGESGATSLQERSEKV